MTWAFNALDHEPSAGIETWPEGWFPVVINKAEEKPTKENNGMMWVLSIKGLPGSPVADKVQFIYIVHKSDKPGAISSGHATMSAIAMCCGVPSFQHPGQLANIPFVVQSQKGNPQKMDDGTERPGLNQFRNFKNMQGIDALDIWKAMKGGGGGQQGGQPQQQFQPQPMQAQQPQPVQQFQPQQQQPVQQFQQQPQPMVQPMQAAPQPMQAAPAPQPGQFQPGAAIQPAPMVQNPDGSWAPQQAPGAPGGAAPWNGGA